MTPSDERPRPARPRPVRENAGPAAQGDGRDRTRGGGGPTPPTPVRDLPEADPGVEAGPPPTPSTTLEIRGVTWTVRVEGRSRVGAPSAAPLLLLGFFRSPDDELPAREVLVPVRSLDGLSEVQLEEAFARAGAPPEPGRRTELFPETSVKGRKGDG